MKIYNDCVVAYIDVLGFKNLINSTLQQGVENEEKTQLIYDAFNAIRDIWDLDSKDPLIRKARMSKKVTIFSDSIVVSFKATDRSGLFYTLLEIMWLIMRLVYKEILCRGAITYGKLHHTQKMIFGPALVEACVAESKAALYPRIILDESIIRICAEYGVNRFSDEKEFIKGLLAQDTDGMYYLEYFSKVQSEFNDPQYDYPDYLERLRKIIVAGVSIDNSIDIRIKHLWMAEKFNRVVAAAKNEDFLQQLNADNEYELADYYRNLAPININI